MERAEQASITMGSLVAAIEGNVNVAKLIGNASQEQMVRIDSMRGQLEELLGTMSENAYKVARYQRHQPGALSPLPVCAISWSNSSSTVQRRCLLKMRTENAASVAAYLGAG
jgi:hypothetical protein